MPTILGKVGIHVAVRCPDNLAALAVQNLVTRLTHQVDRQAEVPIARPEACTVCKGGEERTERSPVCLIQYIVVVAVAVFEITGLEVVGERNRISLDFFVVLIDAGYFPSLEGVDRFPSLSGLT